MIREARKEAHLTQEQVEKRANTQKVLHLPDRERLPAISRLSTFMRIIDQGLVGTIIFSINI